MTKSTGTEKTAAQVGEERQRLITALGVNAEERAAQRAKVVKFYTHMGPPYKAEELMATPWTGFAGATVLPEKINQSSLLLRNPNRVRCPLCRRINTVEIVSQDSPGRGKAVCKYDGCRGLEFDI